MLSSSRKVPDLVGLFATFVMIGAPAESRAQAPPAGARVDRYGDPLPTGAVLRLGTIRYRQDTPIYRIAYTPDGRHFLTDGRDSIIRVWDAATGRIVRRIDPDVGVMADFAVTSRGHLVMAMGTTLEPGRGFVYHVTMTEIATGRPVDVGTWTVDDVLAFTVALCPDRQLVAAEMDKEGVRLLDAWTGAETGRFTTGVLAAERIAFSRDGRRLAVQRWGRDDNDFRRELRVFDVDRKQKLLVEQLDQSSQGEPAFSPDGGTVAVTRSRGLDLLSVGKKDRITFSDAFVNHVCFTSDGRGVVGDPPPRRRHRQGATRDEGRGQGGLGNGLLAGRQDPRRHLRLGIRPDPSVQRRHRQGDTHHQRPGVPLAGTGLHARWLAAGDRHGRRLGAGVGSPPLNPSGSNLDRGFNNEEYSPQRAPRRR